MNTQNQKVKFSLEDLKVQSFITTLDSEVTARLVGGLAQEDEHPTHTVVTQDFEVGHLCTTIQCR